MSREAKLEKERKDYWKYFIDHCSTFMVAYPFYFFFVINGTYKNVDSHATMKALVILMIIGITSVFGSMLLVIGSRWYVCGAIISTITQHVMIAITVLHAYHPGLEWISILVGFLTLAVFAFAHFDASLVILRDLWVGFVTGWGYFCRFVGFVGSRVHAA